MRRDEDQHAREVARGWIERGAIPVGLPPIPMLCRAAELYRLEMAQRREAARPIA